MKNGTVSIRELYTLVDQKIGEVKHSIERLETKFDTLEAGRVSALEKEVANMKGRMMASAAGVSIFIAVIGLIINFILRG